MSKEISDSDNNTYNNSLPARVEISLGNKKCTGKNLLSIFDWLYDHNFNHIEIQLADSLHRHNLCWKLDLDLATAHERALKAGDSWLKENSVTLAHVKSRFKIVEIKRWDDWIKHPEFEHHLEAIKLIFQSDLKFRKLIDKEVKNYFKKIGRRITQERINHSVSYFMEEIAVTEFSNHLNPANEIYPGSRFSPESYLAETYRNSPGFQIGKINFIHLEGS